MRVVHLYDGHERVYQGKGSVPGVVWNIARKTAEHGHDVTVIERKWNELPREAEHEGVSFERFEIRTGSKEPWAQVPYEEVKSPLGLLRLVCDRTNFAFEALRRLRRADFDVLHVHLPFAANVVSTVAPWIRDKMVYTAHLGELRLNLLANDDVLGDGGVIASQDQQSAQPSTPSVLSVFSPDVHLARHAAHTTVLNPDIKSVFADRGISESRLSVIPNGVNIDRFGSISPSDRHRVCDRYGLDPNQPFVLFVGTVMPRKGVVELLEAINRLTHEQGHCQVQAMVAGDTSVDPSYCDTVEGLISRFDLGDTVSMPGFVAEEDLAALYALADVYVVPSLEEGFGMTTVEAMAAGTPVVATRTGDIPRVVDHERHGLLVDPGDVNQLTGALDDLLGDEERLARMSKLTRSRAKEYSWRTVAAEFESVYRSVSR